MRRKYRAKAFVEHGRDGLRRAVLAYLQSQPREATVTATDLRYREIGGRGIDLDDYSTALEELVRLGEIEEVIP